jgi:hypothetical protein
MNGRILWWQTFLAHMRRIGRANHRWWRDVTYWLPVRRYTGFAIYFDTEKPDSTESDNE